MSFFSNLLVGGQKDEDGGGEGEKSFFSSLKALAADPHGALDEFLGDLSSKVSRETETGVYDQCHAQNMPETMRLLVQHAIAEVPVEPPKILGDAAVALLKKWSVPNSKERGVKAFLHDIVERHGVAAAVWNAVCRAMERFMLEHREFIEDVALESLEQKIRSDCVVDTSKEVPYRKPACLPEDEYNRLVPDTSPSERNLFTSVVGGFFNSFGSDTSIMDSIATSLMNDEAVKAKIDKYAIEIKDKLVHHTGRLVYESAHKSQFADKGLRRLIQEALNKAPIHPPAAIRGILADQVDRLDDDDEEELKDAKTKQATAGKKKSFLATKISNMNLDTKLKRAALHGVERFLYEHKTFLKSVAIESAIDKLSDEPVNTAEKVPYVKPAALSVEAFDELHPQSRSIDAFLEGK